MYSILIYIRIALVFISLLYIVHVEFCVEFDSSIKRGKLYYIMYSFLIFYLFYFFITGKI
jgi:hypothetical protein